MISTETDDHMEWLPGLGTPSHSGSKSTSASGAELETGLNTQAADPKVDEVQYSIVCDDCGKHFWSRFKAHSHAALTAHVLHREIISPSSPVTIPDSPVACLASAPNTNTVLTSAKDVEASFNAETSDTEGGTDSEDEERLLRFDSNRHFRSYEAANNNSKIGHMQNTNMVPSSVPEGSPTFAITCPAVTTSSAANPSIHPSFPYWYTGPGTASILTNGDKTPTSPYSNVKAMSGHSLSPTSPVYNGGANWTSPRWTTKQMTSRAISPTSPGYDGGVNPIFPHWTTKQMTGRAISPTSPGYDGGVNPIFPHWTTKQMTGRAISPTSPGYDGGVNPIFPHWTTKQMTGRAISRTSPGYDGGVNPTSMYGITSPESGPAMAVHLKQMARHSVPNVSQ